MFSIYLGLDRQNYQCDECTRAIGTIFGPAKLCSYTKHYYCEECHTDEVSVIPARIVYNWDFKEYKVCRKSKVFLRALSVEPIIDASTFTKTLFNYAKELEDVLKLRKVYISIVFYRNQSKLDIIFKIELETDSDLFIYVSGTKIH